MLMGSQVVRVVQNYYQVRRENEGKSGVRQSQLILGTTFIC